MSISERIIEHFKGVAGIKILLPELKDWIVSNNYQIKKTS